MKLYLESVSPLLFDALQMLMEVEEFNDFRLVGGTSLSLQLGHRESVDIDLFTDAEYGSISFKKLESVLSKIFPYTESLYDGAMGMGKSFFVGYSEADLVKLDLFYTEPFIFSPILQNSIRMASMEEIAAMKLEVIANGGRKKDFWDIHELLDKFSLPQMIGFYLERYPYNLSEKDLMKKIVDFDNAEDDFLPNCYRGKHWELIKLDLEELVKK